MNSAQIQQMMNDLARVDFSHIQVRQRDTVVMIIIALADLKEAVQVFMLPKCFLNDVQEDTCGMKRMRSYENAIHDIYSCSFLVF